MPNIESKKELERIIHFRKSPNRIAIPIRGKLYVLNIKKTVAIKRIVLEAPSLKRTLSHKPHNPRIIPGLTKPSDPIPTKEKPKERRTYYVTKQQESNP